MHHWLLNFLLFLVIKSGCCRQKRLARFLGILRGSKPRSAYPCIYVFLLCNLVKATFLFVISGSQVILRPVSYWVFGLVPWWFRAEPNLLVDTSLCLECSQDWIGGLLELFGVLGYCVGPVVVLNMVLIVVGLLSFG